LKAQLLKDNQTLRKEHEKRLVLLHQHVDEEIAKLKSSVPAEAGSSAAAAGDLGFPEDSID